MLDPDEKNIMAFKAPEDLGEWLEANHNSEKELWVKVFKKGSGVASVDWNEVVIEVLCWGWIDSVRKSLGDLAYLQRITPRKKGSDWSKRNTEHIERLIAEGRVKAPGLVQVRAAKADGRWERAYAIREMKVPADFLAALESDPKVKQFYETLSKSHRFVIAHGLESAKKPETRQRRFQNFMDILIREEKP